ncbi:MAG: precorrin-3B C(17)-methyltransferase [Rhodospirillales bacterium]|nr:precorrin-3B C(17)-methyltransferase [Rhodospirillales bacterium]
MTAIALIALDAHGAKLAQRVKALLPQARLHGLKGRVDGADEHFSETAAHLGRLFQSGTAILGFCASGILMRALAPHLADKQAEPPVLAVAEDDQGVIAVPLLGGHHGANDLARTIARGLGGRAAITGSGDTRLGFGLDDPPPGWRIANAQMAKPIAAALLAGELVRRIVEAGSADWLDPARFGQAGRYAVRVTDQSAPPGPDELVLHPPVLAVGIGCERGASADEMIGLIQDTLDRHGLAAGALAGLFSVDRKADEPAMHEAARHFGVPLRFFTPARLESEAPRLANPSAIVFREIGCHGVSEGAALAAAGPEARLIVAKTKSKRATVAIAKAALPIDAALQGTPQGKLRIIGIGPGREDWRTPEVTRAVIEADALVGYGLYLDLLGDLAQGKRFDGKMGHEEERVRQALDLAGQGRSVCLVCSGDAGIFALATLAFELIEREARPEWRRLDIAVLPGLSALLAAAARAGAPLGHDFAVISLSDLLTPVAMIRARLKAAAEGDFALALYNPVSKTRRTLLNEARDVLLAKRPATTPVVLARNLGRPEETVTVIDLAQLDADKADMLTLVLIGNSETKRVAQGGRVWTFTPRGYAGKHRQDG